MSMDKIFMFQVFTKQTYQLSTRQTSLFTSVKVSLLYSLSLITTVKHL